jgi:hypothetical protein
MAIRVQHSGSPGAVGMAAYMAGRGRAREREKKHLLDIAQQQTQVRERRREQDREMGYRTWLEGQRQMAIGARQKEERQFLIENREDQQLHQMGLAEGRERAATTQNTLDYAQDQFETTRRQIDAIRQQSGGFLQGDMQERWDALQHGLSQIDRDQQDRRQLDPLQAYTLKTQKMQEFLAGFDAARDIVPPRDRPNGRWDDGTWRYERGPDGEAQNMGFVSPEAAQAYYDTLPRTPSGDYLEYDPRRNTTNVIPAGSGGGAGGGGSDARRKWAMDYAQKFTPEDGDPAAYVRKGLTLYDELLGEEGQGGGGGTTDWSTDEDEPPQGRPTASELEWEGGWEPSAGGPEPELSTPLPGPEEAASDNEWWEDEPNAIRQVQAAAFDLDNPTMTPGTQAPTAAPTSPAPVIAAPNIVDPWDARKAEQAQKREAAAARRQAEYEQRRAAQTAAAQQRRGGRRGRMGMDPQFSMSGQASSVGGTTEQRPAGLQRLIDAAKGGNPQAQQALAQMGVSWQL